MPIPTILTDFGFTKCPSYAIIIRKHNGHKSLPKLDLGAVKKTE